MARYIDAEKIKITSAGAAVDPSGDTMVPIRDVLYSVLQTPVEDVVKVVRCKYCVHACFFEGCRNGICDRKGKRAVEKDDFCSGGEKAEE